MASLTTTYIVSTLLASVGAMTAGYVADRISSPPTPPKTEPEPEVEPEPEAEAEAEAEPDLEQRIKDILAETGNGNSDTSKLMLEFLERDELSYQNENPDTVRDKLMQIRSGLGTTCPPKLVEVCKILALKAQNIQAILNGNTEVTTLGDQTQKATELISQPDNQ